MEPPQQRPARKRKAFFSLVDADRGMWFGVRVPRPSRVVIDNSPLPALSTIITRAQVEAMIPTRFISPAEHVPDVLTTCTRKPRGYLKAWDAKSAAVRDVLTELLQESYRRKRILVSATNPSTKQKCAWVLMDCQLYGHTFEEMRRSDDALRSLVLEWRIAHHKFDQVQIGVCKKWPQLWELVQDLYGQVEGWKPATA